ncbi:glycosyltransferase 1 domain-containing protein 1-like isoform X1 [Hydractinia symbiolongicarpus]|uniref:glycosyltransferase 1 domain-containing protein 1-like isoform X1 n=1 Tax=Hydractinia symbiolongicarpus TaxID=13093 RepID=UPI00254FEF27|nr:glycosyltransferase 1 domain-containing protein 1-like isoform X1 [Hydractinia symbiolongicarpus]
MMSVAVLSKLTNGTGNKTTAERICSHLKKRYATHLCDISDFESSRKFNEYVILHEIKAVIGIHLVHAGSLLVDSVVPFALIFGGTDLHVSVENTSKANLMMEVVKKARWNKKSVEYIFVFRSKDEVACSFQRYLIAFTDDMKNTAIKMWDGLAENSIIVQPQGVQTIPGIYGFEDLFSNLEKEAMKVTIDQMRIFLLVGGIRPVKDVTFLFDVFSDWHQQDPSICLVVIGPELDICYAKYCRDKIEILEGIYIFPQVSLEQTHALIKKSFALVNSSLNEGMASAVLEALHIGTPVFARRNTGNSAVINDGINGILFDSPLEFKEKAENLLSNLKMKHKLVSNGTKYIEEKHDYKKELETYLTVAEELLNCRTLST